MISESKTRPERLVTIEAASGINSIEVDVKLMEHTPSQRTERSQLESLAVPARERQSSTEAFGFLQVQGWKQYRLMSPLQSLPNMAAQIAGLLDKVE